jgi:hypothetical protein
VEPAERSVASFPSIHGKSDHLYKSPNGSTLDSSPQFASYIHLPYSIHLNHQFDQPQTIMALSLISTTAPLKVEGSISEKAAVR